MHIIAVSMIWEALAPVRWVRLKVTHSHFEMWLINYASFVGFFGRKNKC